LVVHYGFIWAGPDRRPPPDAGKDRPCLIVDLESSEEPAPVVRSVLRVTYLPISHAPPRGTERAIPVPPRVAVHLGLTAERSYLYTSYAVEDDWPFDLAHVPGTADRFDYGVVPPRFFALVAAEFRAHLAERPGFIHRS